MENVGISAYTLSDLDDTKTFALKQKLIDNDAKSICINDGYVDIDTKLNLSIKKENIAILCFDSMHSRLELAEVCFKAGIKIVIDARMGGEQMQIYTHNNLKDYKDCWYSDAEGSTETCTTKGTSYCSLVVGGIITSQIKKVINGDPYSREIVFHIPSMGMACTTMVKPINNKEREA